MFVVFDEFESEEKAGNGSIVAAILSKTVENV